MAPTIPRGAMTTSKTPTLVSTTLTRTSKSPSKPSTSSLPYPTRIPLPGRGPSSAPFLGREPHLLHRLRLPRRRRRWCRKGASRRGQGVGAWRHHEAQGQSILNASGQAGRMFGNRAGVIGLMYAGLESGIVAITDSDDLINSVAAGLATGALFKAASGPRSAAVAGAVGGLAAGLAVAAKQAVKRYVPI